MRFVSANGIRLAYQRTGRGERVLLIMGQAAGGNVWTMYQVPALTGAGYEVITFDNRGMSPSEVPPGDYSLADLVADAAGLIEALDAGPCRLVGTSLGALVATELATSRPDLVTCCVLMAVRARADALRRALSAGERELRCSGVRQPPAYDASISVLQMFSPATLNDDATVSTLLDVYEMAAGRRAAAGGQDAIDLTSDRRAALRAVPVPCRVIAFSDDLMSPPHLCAEVAEAIPDCDYVEIGSCGHVGYLERPDEVNTAIIEFLDKNLAVVPGALTGQIYPSAARLARGGHDMPYVPTNGIRLAYERAGHGEPVLMIMGSGAGSNVWMMYQVSALNEAGYEVITFDNRGIPPSDVPPGDYSLADLVADTVGLIEALRIGPCRLVGTSMGAVIAAELAVSRPDLVTCCVLMAMRARADTARKALWAADRALAASKAQLPAAYDAAASVFQMLAPASLNDDVTVSAWLDIFEMSAARRASASGQDAIDLISDRRETLQAVPVPCRAIAFTHDVICPPHLCAEVAEAVPDCDFVEIGPGGHIGYLECPDEVNAAIIEFLDKHR